MKGSGKNEYQLISDSLLAQFGKKALQFVADGAMGTLNENRELGTLIVAKEFIIF
jgi:hypothetical protein